MSHIGRADLSRDAPPKIIVSFTGADNPAPAAGMDIAELRLDTLEDARPEAVCEYIQRVREQLPDTPLLGTIRVRTEFGHWRGDEERRLELFEKITPLVDGIDVEFYSAICENACRLALRHHKGLIFSYHHTKEQRPKRPGDKTPSTELSAEIERMHLRRGVWRNSVTNKLAAPAPTLEDVSLLLRILRQSNEADAFGWIVMGMGRQGPLSRIMAAALGSVAVYAYPTHSSVGAVAAGQMSLESTRRYLDIVQGAASLHDGLRHCILLMHRDGAHTPDVSLAHTLHWLDQQPGVKEDRRKFFSPSMLIA